MESLRISKTKVYCWDPHFNKYAIMGNVIADTFFKKVQTKHFMRVCNGYGLQYDAFSQFEAKGITKIEMLERDGECNTWLSSLKDWSEHGHVADYGRGKQIFLSLKYMRLKNKAKIAAEYEEKEHKRFMEKLELQPKLI